MAIPHHHYQSVETNKPTEPLDDSHPIPLSFPPITSDSPSSPLPTMVSSSSSSTSSPSIATTTITTTTTIPTIIDIPHLAMSLCKQPLRSPVQLNRVGHLINRRAELVCKSRKTIPLPHANAALVSRTRHERAKPLMEWTSPLSPNSAAAATARFHHLRFKRIPSRLGVVAVIVPKDHHHSDGGDCAPAQESTPLVVDPHVTLHSSPKRSAPTAPSPASVSSRHSGLLRPLPSRALHHTHAFRDLRVGSLRERAEALKVEKKLEKEKRAQEKEEREAKQKKIDREREKLERRRKFAERRAASLLASAIANDDDDDAASLSPAPLVMAFPPSRSSSSHSSSSSDSDAISPTTTSPTDLTDDLDLDWKSLKKEKLKKKKSRDDSIEDKPRSRKKSGLLLAPPHPPPAAAAAPPSSIPPPVPPKDKKDIKPVVNASVATASPPRAAPIVIAPPRPPSKPGPPAPRQQQRATSPKREATNANTPTSTFTSSYAYDGPLPNRRSPISSSGSRK